MSLFERVAELKDLRLDMFVMIESKCDLSTFLLPLRAVSFFFRPSSMISRSLSRLRRRDKYQRGQKDGSDEC